MTFALHLVAFVTTMQGVRYSKERLSKKDAFREGV